MLNMKTVTKITFMILSDFMVFMAVYQFVIDMEYVFFSGWSDKIMNHGNIIWEGKYERQYFNY